MAHSTSGNGGATSALPGQATDPLARLPAGFAWVAALLAVVLLAHAATVHTMAQTWADRDTYTHGFMVFPIVVGWFWLRRDALRALSIAPSRVGLAVLALLGLAWLMFDAIGARAPGQFATIAMVPSTIAAVLGAAWVRALLFPLA